MSDWHTRAAEVAAGVRGRVLRHVLKNDGGYLSQACSSAEMLAWLYCRGAHLGPSVGPLQPPDFPGVPSAERPRPFNGGAYNGAHAPELDRLIFSPVHYSLALYATLQQVGRLGERALDDFNADGGTVEMIGAEHSPGVEVTAGSLAQAISQAGGIALARKLKGEAGRVWVFMSDGEFQEGQTWEAFAAAAHHGLHNLRIVVDCNAQQCDGPMETVMRVEPLVERLLAFGVDAVEVDGHDLRALDDAALNPTGRADGTGPRVILGRTDPCRGVAPLAQRAPKLHYVRFASPAERAAFAHALETLEAR